MSKRKVLVVDDSATVRQQVRMAFVESGFEVEEAVDGEDGAQRIEKDPSLSAVICDVNMPRMSGLEMIERVAARGIRVPIIMLTTEAHRDKMKRARNAGAKGWVVKPFKPALLVAAIDKLTRSAA